MHQNRAPVIIISRTQQRPLVRRALLKRGPALEILLQIEAIVPAFGEGLNAPVLKIAPPWIEEPGQSVRVFGRLLAAETAAERAAPPLDDEEAYQDDSGQGYEERDEMCCHVEVVRDVI